MTLSIPRLPPDALEEAECPRRDIADGEQRDYSHHRLLMRAHPHLYLTCGLRTHPGHPCPPPFPQLTQPRRSAIVSCAPTPTIPRSDHNKDAVIRPGTLRFPYAQTAERAPISCLFLGDTRLGEGRTISLPRSTLTGAAAKPTAPADTGHRTKGPQRPGNGRRVAGSRRRRPSCRRYARCRARDLGRLDQDEPRGTRPHPGDEPDLLVQRLRHPLQDFGEAIERAVLEAPCRGADVGPVREVDGGSPERGRRCRQPGRLGTFFPCPRDEGAEGIVILQTPWRPPALGEVHNLAQGDLGVTTVLK